MIDTRGLNKADVLTALYNNAKPHGLGFLHYKPEDMTRKQAEKILESGQTYFDYLYGRVMKVDLKSDDGFEEWLYDRNNGTGAAQKAIEGIREVSNEKSNA